MDYLMFVILLSVLTTTVISQVNLALHGTAYQSSTLTNGEASKAIDGKPTNRCLFSQKSVSCTKEESTPYWMVELQDIYRMLQVTVTSRAKSSRKSPWVGYFNVLVGNSSDISEFNVCARRTTKLSDGETASVSCGAVGTHVAIQRVNNPRRKKLCLCEVHIEGVRTCRLGKHGANCEKECPGCKKGLCTVVSGDCQEGCNPGYLGDQCAIQPSTKIQEPSTTKPAKFTIIKPERNTTDGNVIQTTSTIFKTMSTAFKATSASFQTTSASFKITSASIKTTSGFFSQVSTKTSPTYETTYQSKLEANNYTTIESVQTTEKVNKTGTQNPKLEIHTNSVTTQVMPTTNKSTIDVDTSTEPTTLILSAETSTVSSVSNSIDNIATSTRKPKLDTTSSVTSKTTSNSEGTSSQSLTSRRRERPDGKLTGSTENERKTTLQHVPTTVAFKEMSTFMHGGSNRKVTKENEDPSYQRTETIEPQSTQSSTPPNINVLTSTLRPQVSTERGRKTTVERYITTKGKESATSSVPVLIQTSVGPNKDAMEVTSLRSLSTSFTSPSSSEVTSPENGCNLGFYGRFCQYRCPKNCANDCDKMTGECGACSPGFTGYRCALVCPRGLFGLNCMDSCPRTCNRSCTPDDGKCLTVTMSTIKPSIQTTSIFKSTTSASEATTASAVQKTFPKWRNVIPDFTGNSPKREPKLESNTHDSSPPVAAIVVPIMLLLALVVAGVITLFFLLRRVKREAEQKRDQEVGAEIPHGVEGPLAEVSEINENSINKRTNDESINSDEDGPLDVERLTGDLTAAGSHTSTAVLVTELAAHVSDLKKGINQKSFEKEFNSLPTGPQASVEYGSRPEMYSKNRYKDVIVYDHNRVILEPLGGDSCSDYINASYINGYKKKKQYIVTQGPTDTTVYDFVRMLWEQDVPVIIMLTNLVEDGKEKCSPYWPDPEVEGSLQLKEFKIETVRERIRSKYVIRTLFLTRDGNKSEGREIKHCHYVAWPDRERPRDPSALLTFKDDVHYLMEKESSRGPSVVHCSAGVGRSGTYLGIDFLMEQAMEEEQVDVVECVRKLREARADMVQTADQYAFIHELLLEAFFCGQTEIPVSNFLGFINELEENKNTAEGQVLAQQFEILEAICPFYNDQDFKVALLDENKAKNRAKSPLPLDSHRIELLGKNKNTNYINAIEVEAKSIKTSFIVAQTPVLNTIEDFWRMVLQNNSSTIVSLDECKSEDFQPFWPSSEDCDLEFDNKKCSLLSETDFSSYIEREMKIHDKSDEDHFVKQLQLSGWPSDDIVPSDPGHLLDVIEAVTSRIQRLPKNKVIIQCHDAASRSGIFLALLFICRKIDTTQEVDIYHTVNDIKHVRPEFISNLEQYEFLYKFVVDYIINEGGSPPTDNGPSISIAGAW